MSVEALLARPTAEPAADANDQQAIRILRGAYDQTFGDMGTCACDILFDARQYLADRERFIQNRARYGK